MPSPRQVSQRSFGIFPVPRHALHGCTLVNVPKKVEELSWILPVPLHWVQVACVVPGFPPVPPQCSHCDIFASRTVRFAPNTDSREVSSRSMDMSRPRRGLVPPKKSPKISPTSKLKPSEKSRNCEKSKPAPPKP